MDGVWAKQQFSNAFFLRERSLLEELQLGPMLYITHQNWVLVEFLWRTVLEFLYRTVQEVQNSILWAKVGSSDAKLLNKMCLDRWGQHCTYCAIVCEETSCILCNLSQTSNILEYHVILSWQRSPFVVHFVCYWAIRCCLIFIHWRSCDLNCAVVSEEITSNCVVCDVQCQCVIL